ncbi:MAG: hypothetical protein ACYDGN_03070 [Acidimicrobiales bacterium]
MTAPMTIGDLLPEADEPLPGDELELGEDPQAARTNPAVSSNPMGPLRHLRPLIEDM